MDVHLAGWCPEHTLIAVRGDVDLAAADELLAGLYGLLFAGVAGIGLDLSDVTFLDSAGLRALLAVGQCAQYLDSTMCLTAVSPAVTKVLDLIQLPPGSGYLAA